MNWRPNIQKGSFYKLIIPETTIKYKLIRNKINGRLVKVISRVGAYRGHGLFNVRLMDIHGLKITKQPVFKIWGPYLGCNCPWPISSGCKCGGY